MNEYGGYLPLELKRSNINFTKIWPGSENTDVLYFNTGRAAIYYSLRVINPSKVYVPYYICHTVIDVIQALNISYEQYHITKDLKCSIDFVKDTECILVVNYYGIFDTYISEYISNYSNAALLIDNTQAFFCPPIVKENVYNIYSCRKFVGVSDGGFLVRSNLEKEISLPKDFSYKRISYLIKSIELGTHAAYADSKDALRDISHNYCEMSDFTRIFLASIDYTFIKKKRQNNFMLLHSLLKAKNKFQYAEFGEKTIACWYPLLLDKDISEDLIQKHIYVPRLWRELLIENFIETIEYELSSKLILLPVDQRYDSSDMYYINSCIQGILK